MTGPQVLPRSGWSVFLLFVANWIAFANVVSLSGHLLWVLIPSVLAAQAMVIMIRADRRMLAAPVLLLLTVLAAGLSELIGGSTSGPITRATLMMTTCAGLMVLLWRTSVPSSAALVSLAALAGALGLGAADRIVWSVGIWVVCVCAYLVAVGPLRHSDLRDRGRLRSLAAVLLVAGLLASVLGNVLQEVLRDPWTISARGIVAVGAQTVSGAPAQVIDQQRPRSTGVFAKKRARVSGKGSGMSKRSNVPPKAAPTESAPDVEQPPEAPPQRSWLVTVALIVAAVLVLLLLMLTIGLLYVQLRWALLRARLQRGLPAEQVAGAWYWLRLQWARAGHLEFTNVTPDRVAPMAAEMGDRVLRELAQSATFALYDRHPDLDVRDARQAWTAARALARRVGGPLPARLRASLITPATARTTLESGLTTGRRESAELSLAHR